MCPTSQLPGSNDDGIALHEWLGRPVGIRLTNGGDTRSIEIVPLNLNETRYSRLDAHRGGRLRRAASIALELDATLSRLVQKGQPARLNVKRPVPRAPCRLERADEATLLRPRIEELIAPLVFDSSPQSLLRPFQEFGIGWLVEHTVGILADDMGLGKTAQALRALETLVRQGTIRSALVVCPNSLIANWEVECERWVPGLTVVRAVPSKEEADEVWSAILCRSHIIITTYEQLRPLPKVLASAKFELVIADEAHRLRRSQAKIVRAFRLINAERIWALTGTPIERHEVDLATLLSLLEPTRFSVKSAATDSAGLRERARPYVLRRKKKDVLSELPEVIDTKQVVDLTPQQQRAYTSARAQAFPNDMGEILQRFTLLRSICDLDHKSEASVKLDRIVEILQTVKHAGEKAVVFSHLLHPLDVLARRLAREYPLIGSVSLTGELKIDERERVIQHFKSDEKVVALLCSSRVGGEGLTLTEANHVIFINEWWNPSANAQARDRVVRFGQERIVHVHRFRCRGTIEEALDEILNRKSEAFANVVDALATGLQLSESDSKEFIEELLGELALNPREEARNN